jgi:hypothetical protein
MWLVPRYILKFTLRGEIKTMKTSIKKDGKHLDRETNPGHPEYKAGELTTQS